MGQSASEFGSGGRENERAEVASATKPRLGGGRVLSSAGAERVLYAHHMFLIQILVWCSNSLNAFWLEHMGVYHALTLLN